MRSIDKIQRALVSAGGVILLLVLVTGRAGAQDSPHERLSLRCTDCHRKDSWSPLDPAATFDHESTAYPLRGQHRVTGCQNCHTTLRFAGTTTDCYGCHRRDYEAALAVNHRTAGFSTQCTECHEESASGWLASYDHGRSNFPLWGIHASLPCTACHTPPRFTGTAVACVSCHLKEYTATTDPVHTTAKFGTDCETCHRALTWQPASLFPHDQWFPIGSGATHRPGRWNACADCHANASNYAAFECINCHYHNKASTDDIHSRRSGYQYLSSACYRCHSRGG